MRHRIPIPTFLAVLGGLFAFEFAVLAISLRVARKRWDVAVVEANQIHRYVVA